MSLTGLMEHQASPTAAAVEHPLIIMAQTTLHTMDQHGVEGKRLDGMQMLVRPQVTVFKSL